MAVYRENKGDFKMKAFSTIYRGLHSRPDPGKKHKTLSETKTKAKGDEVVAHVKHLPSKYKAHGPVFKPQYCQRKKVRKRKFSLFSHLPCTPTKEKQCEHMAR
jgi:hypothetical protein